MTPIEQHFAEGAIVGDRYRVESLLGQGGFGAVFRATQLNLDRPVALKVLLAEALDDQGLARFQREAEIVQRLEHPNIVRLLDFGHAASRAPYLVFELLEGQTLEEILRREGPLPVARVARVTAQALKALMAAHAQQVVHRDVKPANVFVCNFQGEPDFVKVLDFGIATGGGARALTQRGGVVGTPAYMAPEQVDGREAGFASDLYALGLVVEELLTGKPVFGGASLVDIVREHLSPAPVPHAPEVLRSPLGPLVLRATQKAPERRYPSAAEMLAHLEAVMAHVTPGAYPALPASAPPATAYAPTARPFTPGSHPDLAPPSPLVPPPPARRARKGGGKPWALVGAIGGSAALLAIALIVALSLGRDREGKADPAGAPAAPASAAASSLKWLDLRHDGAIAEAQINGDGVLDFVGFCADGATSLCAVDGSNFGVLWRRPVTAEPGESSGVRLAATGRIVGLVDALGILHLHDLGTGAEQGAIRLGGRVETLCAPPDTRGSLWIRFRDNRSATIDTATRALTASTPRPASCGRGRFEQRCFGGGDPRYCPPESAEPKPSEAFVHEFLVEGANGVGIGTKKTDRSVPMMVGFTPKLGFVTVAVRWQRPLAPGDGLAAVGQAHAAHAELRGGRAVAAYDDAAHGVHLVAVDAATGRTLWDVVTADFVHMSLTPARVYVGRWGRLEVRDAATGRLLGGIGSNPF